MVFIIYTKTYLLLLFLGNGKGHFCKNMVCTMFYIKAKSHMNQFRFVVNYEKEHLRPLFNL